MIGISSPGFSMTPFMEMLEAIAPHFDCWEIIAEGMHAMPNIEKDITACQDSYDMNFAVHAPFSDLNIASLNPKIRVNSIAQVLEAIRTSSDLGIEIVTIHPGFKSPLGAYFPEKVGKIHRQSLVEIDRACEEYDVVLALENIPKMWISLCSFAAEINELIEGTNLKICFDVGHANIANDIDGFLELRGLIANVHLHDNNGQKDGHLVLGEGNINIVGILKNLRGYNGDHVIECLNLEEGIRSKAILKGLLQCI